jgi:hypothetical protein
VVATGLVDFTLMVTPCQDDGAVSAKTAPMLSIAAVIIVTIFWFMLFRGNLVYDKIYIIAD